jgi:hypothetical protein
MKQTEGDRNFSAPTLRTAPVFGGIAGIMTAEQGDTDDGNNMPSMSSKAKESGKLQDMYRRTLAASWAAQAGELPADQCIEDIFVGGDGWAKHNGISTAPSSKIGGSTEDDESEGDSRTLRGHKRNTSGSHDTLRPNRQRKGSKSNPNSPGPVSGRGSIAQHFQSDGESKKFEQRRQGPTNEIDEFTAREDLRSWTISANG